MALGQWENVPGSRRAGTEGRVTAGTAGGLAGRDDHNLSRGLIATERNKWRRAEAGSYITGADLQATGGRHLA